MPDKHYTYGGSTASIWLSCDAAMQLSRMIPYVEPNEAAKRGTRIHNLAVDIYNGNSISEDVAKDELEEASIYIETVRSTFNGSVILEYEFSKSFDCGGTIDGIFYDDDNVWIWDLKTGKTKVVAEHNKQLLFYLFISGQLVYKTVHLGIFQKGSFTWWHPDNYTVDMYMTQFRNRLEYLRNSDTLSFNEGSHCFWCKAKSMCPKKNISVKDIQLKTSNTEF